MAVKQNNTETNDSVGGNAGTATAGSVKTSATGGGGGGSGAGTKTKKMNPNSDGGGGGGGGNADQPGCSGTGASAKIKVGVAVSGGSGIGGGNAGVMPNKTTDIAHILHLIELVELKQQQVAFGQEILIYQHLIVELSRVQTPRQSPDDLKRFKEDIAKVGAFFGKATERRVYLFYLRVVCQLITQCDGETPSCALAVIFQLFSPEMVLEAVQSLLELKISDQNIRKTVRLLSEWLRMCNFCQNLNLWIMAILSGLQDQQKLALFDEIALENIESLFASLILPVLRPKVAPIVFHMLSSINHTPQVFHKILPKFPQVMSFLKQQSNSVQEHAEETKKFMQQLVDLTSALMVRFYGYDALYEPIELALKDFRPSYNYLNYANGTKAQEDGGFGADAVLHSNNAKVGLVNLGNTCYMNSVLQALAMTKEFSREILLSDSKSPLLIKMQQQIALMLYSTRYELTPSRVLNATRPPGFSPGLQQDSSEFLGYLLETLHEQEMIFRKQIAKVTAPEQDAVEPSAKTAKQAEDTVVINPSTEAGAVALIEAAAPAQNGSTGTPPTSVSVSDSHSSSNSSTGTNEAIVSPNRGTNAKAQLGSTAATGSSNSGSSSNTTSNSNTTITTTCASAVAALSTIEKTFTGKLATTYQCLTCGWKSRNVDSFRDLQLSFPEVKNDCASNYSVQDLIDYYCSPEKLYGENQYFCERCKRLSDAERYINVINAPKNLILTLKHFKYDQKYHMRAKLMHKVFHDEKVSVKVCAAETLEEISSVHYDLYAGVVHSGFSMDSGHYYTYAADATNKWYKFNDSIVTPSRSEELHNLTPPNTPYILFYQMGARSNEVLDATASSKVIKVDVPSPLALDELPRELRDYVTHDNSVFSEELRLRHFTSANAAALLKAKNNARRGGGGGGGGGARDPYNNNDEDQPPPASGCGGNAMNINVNRFVF